MKTLISNKIQKFIIYTGLLIVVIPFLSCPAFCYILKGPQIIDLMIKKTGGIDKLQVIQTSVLFSKNENIVWVQETLSYDFPDKFRCDATRDETQKTYIEAENKAAIIIDSKTKPASFSSLGSYKDVILYKSGSLLIERLEKLGIDTNISSIGRFMGKNAYIVGTQYPDESVSQLWVEKDTFIPLRLIIIAKKGYIDEKIDIQYSRWQKTGKLFYPFVTDFYVNQELVREIIVDKMILYPKFEKNFFDINIDKPKEPAPENIGEIRKTIEDFKKIYE